LIVVISLVLTVVLLIAFVAPAVRGAPRGIEDISSALEQLLESNLENPILTIRPQFARNKFLQFSRYPLDSSYGIELAFPRAGWSESYFSKVVTLASKSDEAYEIVDDEEPGLRFVFVKFGASTKGAAHFAENVLTNIFGFPETYRFRIRIS
jgi:hypothetical protein